MFISVGSIVRVQIFIYCMSPGFHAVRRDVSPAAYFSFQKNKTRTHTQKSSAPKGLKYSINVILALFPGNKNIRQT